MGTSGGVCVVIGCWRHPPAGSTICARCWSLVPAETKLAIDGHRDAIRNWWCWGPDLLRDGALGEADREAIRAFREFVLWSWRVTLDQAAAQAFEESEARAEAKLAAYRLSDGPEARP